MANGMNLRTSPNLILLQEQVDLAAGWETLGPTTVGKAITKICGAGQFNSHISLVVQIKRH